MTSPVFKWRKQVRFVNVRFSSHDLYAGHFYHLNTGLVPFVRYQSGFYQRLRILTRVLYFECSYHLNTDFITLLLHLL